MLTLELNLVGGEIVAIDPATIVSIKSATALDGDYYAIVATPYECFEVDDCYHSVANDVRDALEEQQERHKEFMRGLDAEMAEAQRKSDASGVKP